MKIRDAIRNAWKAYTASFGQTMIFLLAELCLTLICLCPLLFLTRPELAPGAWLALFLWIFLLIPVRMNAARAMARGLAGGRLAGPEILETADYGGKLLFGLKRVFFVGLWCIPLIALIIAFWVYFSGGVDSFTVLRMIKNQIGGGDQMRGIWRLVALLAGALVLFGVGCGFHSGARHALAQGDKELPKGHHGKILLCALASLMAVLPLVAALIAVALRYAPALGDLNGLIMKTRKLPSTRGTLMILGAGVLLTLPLLPLKSLISAAYVEGLKGKKE